MLGLQKDKKMARLMRQRVSLANGPRSPDRRVASAVTLIEMLIVVAIISLLVSMVIAVGGRIDNSTKEKGVRDLFGLLETALQEYHDTTGVFPPGTALDPSENCELLYSELHSVPGSRTVLQQISGKLIANKYANLALPIPRPYPEIYDPWGTVLNYLYAPDVNTFPTLISAGPDKDFVRNADNISNW